MKFLVLHNQNCQFEHTVTLVDDIILSHIGVFAKLCI